MSDRASNVELQISEIEMLQSMYPGESDIIFDDEGLLIDMKKFFEGEDEDPNESLKFDVKLPAISTHFEVSFTFPMSYPSNETLSAIIRCNAMNKVQYKAVNEAMNKYIEELGVGDLCLFQVIEWINENGGNYITIKEDKEPEGTDTITPDTDNEIFSRFWIYSHHIYSKTKRKNILEWAKELELTGFSMPGKPGVVCVEGPRENCEEFWQRMKRQTWKRLSLAHIEEGTLHSQDGKQFERKFTDPVAEKDFGVHGGRDYHMDLGQFAKYLDEHCSKEVFSLIFGVEGKFDVQG